MNPTPLNDADLDRLEELLEADIFNGDAMRLDEIQAILCAVVSGPVSVPPTVWLPEVLGEGMASAEGDPILGEAVELLMRLNNDIAAALLADETVSPVLYPLDEKCEDYDYAAWADSYVFGAGMAGDWYELAGKHADDLSELLEPMFLLNGMLKEDVEKSGERWFAPAVEVVYRERDRRTSGRTVERETDQDRRMIRQWRGDGHERLLRHRTRPACQRVAVLHDRKVA